MSKTRYMVLVAGNDNAWHLYQDDVEATSSVGAIRSAVNGKAGTYVAIPDRSFKPRTVEIETQHRVVVKVD